MSADDRRTIHNVAPDIFFDAAHLCTVRSLYTPIQEKIDSMPVHTRGAVSFHGQLGLLQRAAGNPDNATLAKSRSRPISPRCTAGPRQISAPSKRRRNWAAANLSSCASARLLYVRAAGLDRCRAVPWRGHFSRSATMKECRARLGEGSRGEECRARPARARLNPRGSGSP